MYFTYLRAGMLLSAETVDGLVHQLGGARLRAECMLATPHRRRRRCRDGDDDRTGIAPPSSVDGDVCPVGHAVATSPGGDGLGRHYDAIIHTTPPFYDYPPPPHPIATAAAATGGRGGVGDGGDDAPHARSRMLLGSCYRRSFELAFGGGGGDDDDDAPPSSGSSRDGRRRMWDYYCGAMRDSLRRSLVGGLARSGGHPVAADGGGPGGGGRRVAVPLLGSGCRAFPKDVASDVAASEAASWLLSGRAGDDDDVERRAAGNANEDDGNEDSVVVFGLLERDDAEVLSAKLKKRLLSD